MMQVRVMLFFVLLFLLATAICAEPTFSVGNIRKTRDSEDLSKTQKTEVTTTLAEDKHSADVSTEQVDTAAQEEAKKVEAEQAAAQEEAKRIEAEQAAAQEEAIYPLSIHY